MAADYGPAGYGTSAAVAASARECARPSPADSTPRAAEALEIIAKLVGEQRELLDMLEARLDPVLQPQPPAGNESGPGGVPHLIASPLVGRIRETADRLSRGNDKIQLLLRRLEI